MRYFALTAALLGAASAIPMTSLNINTKRNMLLPRAPGAPSDLCCFSITANGPPPLPDVIEEDTIGQNRIFSTYPDGYYCVDPAQPTALKDSLGHTCVVYASTSQFQCTQGIPSNVNFTIADNGDFLVDGSNGFLACPAEGPGNDGSFNIFTNEKENKIGCIAITLSSTGAKCKSSQLGEDYGSGNNAGTPFPNSTIPAQTPGVATPSPFLTATTYPGVARPATTSSSSVESFSTTLSTIGSVSESADFTIQTSTPVSSQPASTPTPFDVTTTSAPIESSLSAPSSTTTPTTSASATCPTDLSGLYLAPNLIVPVDPKNPSTAYGTQYRAQVGPSNSTLFSFDVPENWEGETCSLLFTFPYASDTALPAEFYFSGVEAQIGSDGGFVFDKLSTPISTEVTWDSKPEVEESYGKTVLIPGNTYNLKTENCRAGERLTYQMSEQGEVILNYFQLAGGGKPVGLWIVQC